MDALSPSPTLLCNLASIAVHAEEALGPKGHHFDKIALQNSLENPEVKAWLAEMTELGMAPIKRD